MKAVKFKEVNMTFAENQDQYNSLPVLKYTDKEGSVVSCFQLTWGERFRIFFNGKMWLMLLTFHKPLTPIFMTTKKSDVIDESQFKTE